MKAYITTSNGNLVAEYSDLELDLQDAGLADKFGFGETVELEYEPNDIWELQAQLERA